MLNLIEDGFEILENFISQDWVARIIEEINKGEFHTESGGIRNVNKKLKIVEEYLESEEFKYKSSLFLPRSAQLVRAILFNKSAGSNWYVTWHQDRTVCVSSTFDDKDWKAWSIKENILHVQPPVEVLENMLTLRVHLDSASNENGCLNVIPKSHRLGMIPTENIMNTVNANDIYSCEVESGDALIMRPLLIHASSKSAVPSNRRVLHFEFSSWQLPHSVCWG